MKPTKSPNTFTQTLREFGLVTLCFVLVLGWLFRQALVPDYATFSNDTPLGLLQAALGRNENVFFDGAWYDLNWLGITGVATPPNVTGLFMFLLVKLASSAALIYAKFSAPLSLLFVGLSFWACLKMWKFSPVVCFLGGLAAILHGDFLPNSCWGVSTQVIGFGLNFLAIGFLADESPRTRWASVILAGFAVGLGVTEAYDIGALFSLTVAAFVLWRAIAQSLAQREKLVRNLLLGGIRLALVAVCAGWISASMVKSAVNTQIQGISGMAQDEATKAQRWADATMWSMYKRETIGIFVPAFFGFRMDTTKGGEYWGTGGRVEGWDRYLAEGPMAAGDVVRVQAMGSAALTQPRQFQVGTDGKLALPGAEPITVAGLSHKQAEDAVKAAMSKTGVTSMTFQIDIPRGFIKYGGGSGYAGAIVLVLAAWAFFQSLRAKDSAFTPFERSMVWFWFAVAAVSLLLCFGRFAPFYQIFYSLPYASVIRIPGKFGHIFAWATLILFAYGAQGLWRRYIESAPATTRGLLDQWRVWWSKVGTFDRRWIVGCGLVFVLALAAWAVYALNRSAVETYIAKLNYYEMITQGQQPDEQTAGTEARAQMGFSLRQAAKAVFFYGAALGLIAFCLTGYFGGARSKIATGLFTVLILAELGPASVPWVITYNWKEKYLDAGNNPVIQFLRQRPHENRVAISSGTLPGIPLGILDPVYGGDWKQHLFQYFNIQTIDVVQMPRPPIEVQNWEMALHFNGTPENLYLAWRRWELMNVRYILTRAGATDALNQQLKPNAPFRELMRFDFFQARQGGTILTQTNAQAQFALVEYTGALPRTKLYSNWQVSTNDDATLQTLRNVNFDPATTVLLSEPITASPTTNASVGSVEFINYKPKHVSLKANAAAPSVLLLNDKYDAAWKAYVDGQPAPLLRCNYVMRGVQLPAGAHTVEFRYQPPLQMLWVSLSALVVLFGLIAYTLYTRWRAAT